MEGFLGVSAKDKVTGFKGTVTAIHHRLHGDTQLQLESFDGEKIESYWFPVDRLSIDTTPKAPFDETEETEPF